MNDRAIRDFMLPAFAGELVVEELTLPETRIDIAVIHADHIAGYEIKGKTDSLRRLPLQVQCYSAVCGYAHVLAYGHHADKIVCAELVPDWWAVSRIMEGEAEIIRSGARNPKLESRAMLNILWVAELKAKCRELGVAKSICNGSGDKMRTALKSELDVDQVSAFMCQAIRDRGDWREGTNQSSLTPKLTGCSSTRTHPTPDSIPLTVDIRTITLL